MSGYAGERLLVDRCFSIVQGCVCVCVCEYVSVAQALMSLSQCYSRGRGCAVNVEKGIELKKRAIAMGFMEDWQDDKPKKKAAPK